MAAFLSLIMLILLLFTPGYEGFDSTSLYGLSHLGVTVPDLDKATSFYTKIMGGMKVEDLSSNGVHGDNYYYSMFQKEVVEAQEKGILPSTIGVPDISADGDHEVIHIQEYTQKRFCNITVVLVLYSSTTHCCSGWTLL